jgi:hypothetical protein
MATWPAINFQDTLNSAQQLQCQHRKGNTQDQYLESQKAAGMFFFTDYVALNYIAGGDDGCRHIMDTL